METLTSVLYSSAWLFMWVLLVIYLTVSLLKLVERVTNRQIIIASLMVTLISQIFGYLRQIIQKAVAIISLNIQTETIIGLILYFIFVFLVVKFYWKFDKNKALKFSLVSAIILEAIALVFYSLHFL